ncbi:MAG: OmpH family outer membrane protein [Sporocytophaga sp.]|uniref:OmpH family outer membrane protein n=1 Tax=Sporocytophaga TaxID=1011 RepID=UPI0004162C7C|nr:MULTISPECIES: OmpH family outer membrane protein [Sporocytophaga]MBO9702317.1 OmpH family outer membrane protein [Sporocytophaga sp.]
MRTLGVLFLLCLITLSVNAQKFGYIDSDYILKKLPEYAKAEKELNMLSSKWQADIEKMKKEYEKMQTDFKAEEILLTEDMKKERLDTLAGREKAIKEYQKKIFGFEGMIFLKRQELMKPVQDKVFEAVEKVAKAKSLQIIFDKSGDLVMVYTNPIHDYTDYVLEELGLGDPNDTAEK